MPIPKEVKICQCEKCGNLHTLKEEMLWHFFKSGYKRGYSQGVEDTVLKHKRSKRKCH